MKLKGIINKSCLLNSVGKRYLVKEIRQWVKGIVPKKKKFGKMYIKMYGCGGRVIAAHDMCREEMFRNIEEQ